MDALTSLLDGLDLRARLIYTGGACGPWGIDHNSDRDLWFHLVTKGRGWIHSAAWAQPLPVEVGDLVFFLPHAVKHYLSYSPDCLRFDAPDARKVPMRDGTTGFVCGMLELALPHSLLWSALPAEIVVRRSEAESSLARLVAFLIDEASHDRFGRVPVIERLCDGLLMMVLRHCLERGVVDRGVFAAMQDPRLEPVLAQIHAAPEKPWTLRTLCGQAGVSRTVLTERFDALIGCPPMEYVTQIRLQFAAAWLQDSALPLDRVAERCGYASASAFSRAFKKYFGQSPGTYRRTLTGRTRPADPTH